MCMVHKLSGYTSNKELETYFDKIYAGSEEVLAGKIEVGGKEALLKYQLKYSSKKILLYGAGKIGLMTLFWLKREGICPCFIVDKDSKKTGKEILGVQIIDLFNLRDIVSNNKGKYILILAVDLAEAENEVKKELFQIGIDEIMDIDLKNVYDISFPSPEIFYSKSHFKNVLRMLNDMESKEILCELLRTVFYNDFYRLEEKESSEKYWGKGIILPKEDETFVCLGGGIGDTIFYFLDHYDDKFKKIYCFEPEIMNRVKYNTGILPKYIKDKIEYVEYYAGNSKIDNIVRLDDYFGQAKVSLISMDIEGAEMEALYGADRIIQEQKPVLAISAYHKWDDLIRFIQFLSDVKEYRFYLRKYASLHRMNRNETVLYAIPEERICR